MAVFPLRSLVTWNMAKTVNWGRSVVLAVSGAAVVQSKSPISN